MRTVSHPSPPISRCCGTGSQLVQSDAKLRTTRAVLKTPATGLTRCSLLRPTSTSDLCLNRKTFFGGFYGWSFICSSSGTRLVCALPRWIKFDHILLFHVLKYSIKSSDQKSIALRITAYLLFFVVFHVFFVSNHS